MTLEKYGISSTKLDERKCWESVLKKLQETFQFSPHRGTWNVLAEENGRQLYRAILREQGYNKELIERELQSHYNLFPAATLYTGDLHINPPFKYIVFLGRPGILPLVLGEEITHGEHMASFADKGFSYKEDFHQRFDEVALEFIGHLGYWIILEDLQAVETLDDSFQARDLNTAYELLDHAIAYTAVEIIAKNFDNIPYPDLFHASNQRDMWGIVRDGVKQPLPIKFKVPFDPPPIIKDRALEIVRKSGAEDLIQVMFEVDRDLETLPTNKTVFPRK